MNWNIAYSFVAGVAAGMGIYETINKAWNRRLDIAIRRVVDRLGWGNTMTTAEISQAIKKSPRKTGNRLWELRFDGKVSHKTDAHGTDLWGPVRGQSTGNRYPGRF
jgi:hypothetical protein